MPQVLAVELSGSVLRPGSASRAEDFRELIAWLPGEASTQCFGAGVADSGAEALGKVLPHLSGHVSGALRVAVGELALGRCPVSPGRGHDGGRVGECERGLVPPSSVNAWERCTLSFWGG